MKCKRCLSQVPKDVDVCPNCGQDLASLRQLLKNFYAEEPIPSEEQNPHSFEPGDLLAPGLKGAPPKTEPRITLESKFPAYGPEFSLADALSAEEPADDDEIAALAEPSPRGGFWLRSMAFAVDHFIILFALMIFAVLGFLAAEIGAGGGRVMSIYQQGRIVLPVLFPLAIILALCYFTFFHGAWGQTIGKMIFGLRVVKTDSQPMTFSCALGRTLGYFLSALPFFLGFLWVGFISSKRSWHDALAGTMVIRE